MDVDVNLPQKMKLYFDGADCLRKLAEPWDFNKDTDALAFAKEMYNLMQQYSGIGLAAPQVGVSKRVIVSIFNNYAGYYFNPEIVSSSNELIKFKDGEGCLSFPGINLHVPRCKSIVVKWQNENGNICQSEFAGLPAIVLQHEIDHLDGKLFVDYFGKMGKDIIKRKQSKFLKKMKISIDNYQQGRG